MTDRALLQQALEALEWNLPVIEDYGDREQLNRQHRAITTLRERLAQPEQEPVATVESVATVVSESGNQEVTMSWWHDPALPVGTKLYTTPPQRKPLTDDEADELVRRYARYELIRAIEAAHGIKENT